MCFLYFIRFFPSPILLANFLSILLLLSPFISRLPHFSIISNLPLHFPPPVSFCSTCAPLPCCYGQSLYRLQTNRYQLILNNNCLPSMPHGDGDFLMVVALVFHFRISPPCLGFKISLNSHNSGCDSQNKRDSLNQFICFNNVGNVELITDGDCNLDFETKNRTLKKHRRSIMRIPFAINGGLYSFIFSVFSSISLFQFIFHSAPLTH